MNYTRSFPNINVDVVSPLLPGKVRHLLIFIAAIFKNGDTSQQS
jgi:hypothetical protein